MPTRDSELLLDTSVAVPLMVRDHEHHELAVDAVRGVKRGLAGHAAFETYSVLTRLPGPSRRRPAAVQRLLTTNFPATRFLSAEQTKRLFEWLAEVGVAGGSVYDALVGWAALQHKLPLVTSDRRALVTYRALDVDLMIV